MFILIECDFWVLITVVTLLKSASFIFSTPFKDIFREYKMFWMFNTKVNVPDQSKGTGYYEGRRWRVVCIPDDRMVQGH